MLLSCSARTSSVTASSQPPVTTSGFVREIGARGGRGRLRSDGPGQLAPDSPCRLGVEGAPRHFACNQTSRPSSRSAIARPGPRVDPVTAAPWPASHIDPVASEDLDRLRVAAHGDDVIGLEHDPEPSLSALPRAPCDLSNPVKVLADLQRLDVGVGRQVERLSERLSHFVAGHGLSHKRGVVASAFDDLCPSPTEASKPRRVRRGCPRAVAPTCRTVVTVTLCWTWRASVCRAQATGAGW